MLGSGGPVGGGRAASGYVVSVDGTPRLLVDVGPGAFLRLGEMGLDTSAVDVVLLTHLHIDHAGDLPGFVKSRDLSSNDDLTFRIFGPQGRGVYPSTRDFVDRMFGANGAFAYLSTFRNSLQFVVTDLSVDASAPPSSVLEDRGIRVTTIATDHGDVPSVAYRVDAGGHSVVFSGDLGSRTNNLSVLASGADLLIYNAVVLDPPGSPAGLYELHTTPARIGEVAAAAKVGSVLLSHLPRQVLDAQSDVVRSVRKRYTGDVRFADDCLRIGVSR